MFDLLLILYVAVLPFVIFFLFYKVKQLEKEVKDLKEKNGKSSL